MRKKVLIIAGAIVLLIAMTVVLSSNRGGLGDFSPFTLEFRAQSERTIFATQIPIYRSKYQYGTVKNPLVTMLVEEGFVSPMDAPDNHWLPIYHWNDAWRDGYGYLYHVFFRDRDRTMAWSLENRECAEIYWREGFQLLRSENANEVQAGESILAECWLFDNVDELRLNIDRIKAESRR